MHIYCAELGFDVHPANCKHARCEDVRGEISFDDSLRLFRGGQFRPARKGRVWNRPPRTRRSRGQVRVKPITAKGEPDKRFNWKKVA